MSIDLPGYDKNYMFNEIFNHVNDGINVIDENGILVFVNEESAKYANKSIDEMLNKPIDEFYPHSALRDLMVDKKEIVGRKINYKNGKRYLVNAYPFFIDGKFKGGFSVFKSIDDIEQLNERLNHLELQIKLSKSESHNESIVGANGSLKNIIKKARKTVGALGGPRHSIITGQSGTGKSMLAYYIYLYAKEIGALGKDAPFIEVNCAQFTNPDIAAIEIFGSEKGAFTGSTNKKGLFEQADKGVLFLDEAHALGNHQTMLLKAIESRNIRKIGGTKLQNVDVIIIAASTKNLKEVLLPELYQRLAQYELYLPPLAERTKQEKEDLLKHFTDKYEENVLTINKINLEVNYTPIAKVALLDAEYPRNIRQFRDVINASIDSACPLISDIKPYSSIDVYVDSTHIPTHTNSFVDNSTSSKTFDINSNPYYLKTVLPKQMILDLRNNGLGPRKISKILQEQGYDIKYYQIAYYLKKCGK
ncbi:sigma 54-interacting transcriptional regulator [Abyssisolibacter fermentans]|uniref:sigma 54-interacting transcriptional regulator n=1 Tax=Abyssisolibacter fermentans TaxID=1766203 RepID=UPI00082E6480|nr:sigma 54-interacting transcriptional regulator [Abyssisolibacter fermentans]